MSTHSFENRYSLEFAVFIRIIKYYGIFKK